MSVNFAFAVGLYITDAGLSCAKKIAVFFSTLRKKPYLCSANRQWKDAGAVERDGLENRCTLTGTQGSNPCLSATEPQVVDLWLCFYGKRRWKPGGLVKRGSITFPLFFAQTV